MYKSALLSLSALCAEGKDGMMELVSSQEWVRNYQSWVGSCSAGSTLLSPRNNHKGTS